MPSNKKHHYVPRFYLKNFSNDERSISLFNLKTQKIVARANLKNQCYRDYFYGREPAAEKALAVIEAIAAQSIQSIVAGIVPNRDSQEYGTLLLYTLTQYGRTAYAADALNETIEKLMKHLLAPRGDLSAEDLDGVRIGHKEPGQIALALCLLNYPILIDLEYKLITIAGTGEFITSDNPVILYNQLFRFRRLGSNTGLAQKGLQLFFPLSAKHLLMFYDAAVYAVGRRHDRVVNIISSIDVDELNTLQIVSAYENVYFQNSTMDILRLYERAQKYLRTKKTDVNVFVQDETQTRREELIASSREDIRTDLKLSFVRIVRRAKQWRMAFMKLKQQPVSVVRDPQLLEYHDEFSRLVFEGKAEASDFFEWLRDSKGWTVRYAAD